uniref:Choline transporter-like protein n=1 Tax=Xenopsylla cheopis TaxID=163159 RepID=A0A6M2DXS4_XENCH
MRYDPDFRGPLRNRSCTDVFFLILFIVFLVGWAGIGFYALKHGSLNNILGPTDSLGRKCGVDSDVLDKPYLLFFDLMKCAKPGVVINGCPTPQICVKECPSDNFAFETHFSRNTSPEEIRQRLFCKPEVDKSRQIQDFDSARRLVQNEQCAAWHLKSQPVSRRCIPNPVNRTELQIEGFSPDSLRKALRNVKRMARANEVGTMVVEDIVASWWKILLTLCCSMLVCLCYIVLMRWLAAPMVWFSIFGVLCMLAFGTYITFRNFIRLKHANVERSVANTNIKNLAKNIFDKEGYWLTLGIIMAILFVVLILVVIFLRKKIVVAIALIKEGSRAVSSVTTTLAFPIFPWIFQTLVIAYAVVIALHLSSIGEQDFKVVGMTEDWTCSGDALSYKNNASCTPEVFNKFCTKRYNNHPDEFATCHLKGIDNPAQVNWFHAYNVLGFFWVLFFISALGDMILAATFATWYWTFNKDNVPYFTLTAGLARTFRYHLGTLAFGSLILAICRIIRVILEYIDQKLKKFDNPCTRCLLCFLKCFFWCLENFIKFINKNAYIMCAIHGKNFCSSAKDSFALILRNCTKYIVVDKTTEFVFFMSKVLISAGMGALSYLYFGNDWAQLNDDTLHYGYAPVILVVIGTFFITCVFFGVYDMAVDTLLLCFLEDSERNDGSPERPYYMSKELMKILGRKNKVIE